MFTCPGCGYRTFCEPPGSYEICRVCGWEDDAVQLLDPWYAGGANRPSLAEWQDWHAADGTTALDAALDNSLDERWRPIRESDRIHVRRLRDIRLPAGEVDLVQWYYWLRDEA